MNQPNVGLCHQWQARTLRESRTRSRIRTIGLQNIASMVQRTAHERSRPRVVEDESRSLQPNAMSTPRQPDLLVAFRNEYRGVILRHLCQASEVKSVGNPTMEDPCFSYLPPEPSTLDNMSVGRPCLRKYAEPQCSTETPATIQMVSRSMLAEPLKRNVNYRRRPEHRLTED